MIQLRHSPSRNISTVAGSRAVHPLVTDNMYLGLLSVTDAQHPPPDAPSWEAYGQMLPRAYEVFAPRDFVPFASEWDFTERQLGVPGWASSR